MDNSTTYFWTLEKRNLLIIKYPNTSKSELLSLFSSRPWKNICDTAQRLGVSRLTYYKNNETSKLGNINNLLNKNLESLYWLGFLLADAYICDIRGRIQIQLHEKDLQLLQNFCKYIDYTGPLKIWDRPDKHNKLGYSKAIKIDLQDKVNVLKLIDLFKFKTPKPQNPKTPNRNVVVSYNQLRRNGLRQDLWRSLHKAGSKSRHRNFWGCRHNPRWRSSLAGFQSRVQRPLC